MIVSFFKQDISQKSNVLIRGLAVRTMGCLRVQKLNEYLIDSIMLCIKDKFPFVRKCAVLSIPKLYACSPDVVIKAKGVECLQEQLESESNPMVLSNIILALKEIQNITGDRLINLNSKTLKKILVSINECFEWGQIEFLDCISQYVPEDTKQTEEIIERILPRLSHINAAVAFAAIKIILKYIDYLNDTGVINHLFSKLKPSLISLITQNSAETKYCILKNIPHILQKRPDLFEKDIKCFFCQFNEPYYIKKEKLQLLESIANTKNVEMVVNELKEYTQEVDIEFVRMSMKVLTTLCVKYDSIVDQSLDIFLGSIQLIQQKGDINGLSQEIMVQMQKIFRKHQYKYSYNNILLELYKIMDLAQENDAKTACAWIVGEYAEKISDPIKFIEEKSVTFLEEDRQTQLEILTAAVKIFLKYCEESQQIIFKLLQLGAYDSTNPDVRDRSYIYWNMLATDAKYASETILFQKPDIQEKKVTYDDDFLEDMIDNLGNINTIYNKYQTQLFTKQMKVATQGKPKIVDTSKKVKKVIQPEPEEGIQDLPAPQKMIDDDPFGIMGAPEPVQQPASDPQIKNNPTNILDDFPVANNNVAPVLNNIQAPSNNIQAPLNNIQAPTNEAPNLLDDLLGDPAPAQTQNNAFFNPIKQVPMELVLNSNTNGQNGQNGVQVNAAINLADQLELQLEITTFNQPINEISIQFKQNAFLIQNMNQVQAFIGQGQMQKVVYSLSQSPNNNINVNEIGNPFMFTLGMKTNIDTFYFQIPCMVHTLFTPCQTDQAQFGNI